MVPEDRAVRFTRRHHPPLQPARPAPGHFKPHRPALRPARLEAPGDPEGGHGAHVEGEPPSLRGLPEESGADPDSRERHSSRPLQSGRRLGQEALSAGSGPRSPGDDGRSTPAVPAAPGAGQGATRRPGESHPRDAPDVRPHHGARLLRGRSPLLRTVQRGVLQRDQILPRSFPRKGPG